ncbi:MAG: aspartate-semialdehyde dehydrogenase [Gammaproteobacteria bacterium CG11_big_fil_rev_8_21_14_0_20_46_22]|nr:MAG: aspartate-semialdehyde dehydrogenase [Gammaproteobacteria bacterium CG11_big_fil_rev_8_21_14_0_20_46_22]
MSLRLAVVGATGLVGETLLDILGSRKALPEALYLVASQQSAGEILDVGNKPFEVQSLEDFDFSLVDVAIFSAGEAVAKQYASKAIKAGCTVIDNSSAFRYDDDVPLVIPEVNGERLKTIVRPCVIANPNCSTIQMLMAIHPLRALAKLERIDVATYQSVSGAGRDALNELVMETRALLNMQSYTRKVFPKQIAFNMIPHIDAFQDNGYTREEMKMVWETRKIFADETIEVNPTAVRVPAFYGHAEVLHLRFASPVSAELATERLKKALGVKVLDRRKDGGYPTQVGDASGSDDVFVGRIRNDLNNPCGLNLWVVADNLRKGAALNALQIAERL